MARCPVNRRMEYAAAMDFPPDLYRKLLSLPSQKCGLEIRREVRRQKGSQKSRKLEYWCRLIQWYLTFYFKFSDQKFSHWRAPSESLKATTKCRIQTTWTQSKRSIITPAKSQHVYHLERVTCCMFMPKIVQVGGMELQQIKEVLLIN